MENRIITISRQYGSGGQRSFMPGWMEGGWNVTTFVLTAVFMGLRGQ